MNKLVVLGSVNADHVLQVPSFPRPGETLHGRNYQVIPALPPYFYTPQCNCLQYGETATTGLQIRRNDPWVGGAGGHYPLCPAHRCLPTVE